jgi:hypothetical protein
VDILEVLVLEHELFGVVLQGRIFITAFQAAFDVVTVLRPISSHMRLQSFSM